MTEDAKVWGTETQQLRKTAAKPAGDFVPASRLEDGLADGEGPEGRVLLVYTHLGPRRIPVERIKRIFPVLVPRDKWEYSVVLEPGLRICYNGQPTARAVYGIRMSTARWLCGQLGARFEEGREAVFWGQSPPRGQEGCDGRWAYKAAAASSAL